PADYDKVQELDRFSIKGLGALAPDKNIDVEIKHIDGTTEVIEVKHTMTEEQIGWFKAGSALNLIRENSQKN
ncbi:MAG: hypothetical protein WCT03_25210, partial [Candidatus Obscuribacterales bacterium]